MDQSSHCQVVVNQESDTKNGAFGAPLTVIFFFFFFSSALRYLTVFLELPIEIDREKKELSVLELFPIVIHLVLHHRMSFFFFFFFVGNQVPFSPLPFISLLYYWILVSVGGCRWNYLLTVALVSPRAGVSR